MAKSSKGLPATAKVSTATYSKVKSLGTVTVKAKAKVKPLPDKARPSKARLKVAKSKAPPLPSSGPDRRSIYKALELLSEYTGPFKAEHVAPTRHALWTARGTYYLPAGSTYDTVLEILEAWSESSRIERAIGKRRTARIQVAWSQGRGRSGEYTLSEIGPWDFTLDRAIERVSVRDGDRDGLVVRYGLDGQTSHVSRIYVWLGSDIREASGYAF